MLILNTQSQNISWFLHVGVCFQLKILFFELDLVGKKYIKIMMLKENGTSAFFFLPWPNRIEVKKENCQEYPRTTILRRVPVDFFSWKVWWLRINQKSNILNVYLYWTFEPFYGIKDMPANAGETRDASSIPGSGRSPGGGHVNPLH